MKRINELNVEPVVIDMTGRDKLMVKDLDRADRKIIPVNIIYPANYSSDKSGAPAIMLEGVITPQDALDALDIIEKFSK